MPKPQLLKAAIYEPANPPLVRCSVLDSAEHITKILHRIQVVIADVGKVRHQASKAHALAGFPLGLRMLPLSACPHGRLPQIVMIFAGFGVLTIGCNLKTSLLLLDSLQLCLC